MKPIAYILVGSLFEEHPMCDHDECFILSRSALYRKISRAIGPRGFFLIKVYSISKEMR